jgi:hypothetical protein
MKKHTKIYLEHFDYTIADFIPCEVCGTKSVDIHHIEPKGMGGSKSKDYIGNLIAVCRLCHVAAHSNQLTKNYLKHVHEIKINGQDN